MTHHRRITAVALTAAMLMFTSACSPNDTSSQPGVSIDDGETNTEQRATPSKQQVTTMPDFVGQDVTEAEESLQELGVQFDTVHRASPEESGTVLSQNPVRGEPLDGTDVTITVAGDPPAVPEVVGMSFAEAKQQLEDQGFTVEERAILKGEATDGEVLAQDPGVGTPNAATVTLDVARRPVASALSDMELLSVDGDVEAEQAKANGVTYPMALLVSNRYSEDPTTFGVDLSRTYRQVVGDIGLSDDSNDACSATVSFSGDGRTLGGSPYSLAFGETENIEFTADGVLRLTTTVAASGENCTVVLGDFRAEGLESEVEPVPSPDASN